MAIHKNVVISACMKNPLTRIPNNLVRKEKHD